jgi:transcriptional regulator with XRE-family HTH domain
MWISNLSDLSEQFKRARITSRLTQREAAAAAGVSSLLVSQFERGALTELGTVKLLSLLRAVGLELQIRPAINAPWTTSRPNSTRRRRPNGRSASCSACATRRGGPDGRLLQPRLRRSA